MDNYPNILSKLMSISVFLLGNLPLLAQHLNSSESAGPIKGIVLNSNIPVEFANVFITMTSDTTKNYCRISNRQLGRFHIGKLNPGDYILNVQMIGYKD